jgi:hypothetical protein
VLAGVDGVVAINTPSSANGHPDARRLSVAADPAVRSALVRALLAAGIDVEEISVQRNLEDVFLTLVGADTSGHAVGSGGRLARSSDDLETANPGAG